MKVVKETRYRRTKGETFVIYSRIKLFDGEAVTVYELRHFDSVGNTVLVTDVILEDLGSEIENFFKS